MGADPGFFHHQPQHQPDGGGDGDHEDAIERQEDAADRDALRQHRRRVDVEVVAGPQIERGLLEQKREADREQNLTQRVEAKLPQKDTLHRESEERNGDRRDRNREQP